MVEPYEVIGDSEFRQIKKGDQDRERLEKGDVVEFKKTITTEDVNKFAEASGDTNPLHIDKEFASRTSFENPVVHGVLTLGLISSAFGQSDIKGIYKNIDMNFENPVYHGETITAYCEVIEEISFSRKKFEVTIHSGPSPEEGEVKSHGTSVVVDSNRIVPGHDKDEFNAEDVDTF